MREIPSGPERLRERYRHALTEAATPAPSAASAFAPGRVVETRR
jgi:hypothetical protein